MTSMIGEVYDGIKGIQDALKRLHRNGVFQRNTVLFTTKLRVEE